MRSVSTYSHGAATDRHLPPGCRRQSTPNGAPGRLRARPKSCRNICQSGCIQSPPKRFPHRLKSLPAASTLGGFPTRADQVPSRFNTPRPASKILHLCGPPSPWQMLHRSFGNAAVRQSCSIFDGSMSAERTRNRFRLLNGKDRDCPKLAWKHKLQLLPRGSLPVLFRFLIIENWGILLPTNQRLPASGICLYLRPCV